MSPYWEWLTLKVPHRKTRSVIEDYDGVITDISDDYRDTGVEEGWLEYERHYEEDDLVVLVYHQK